METMNQEIASGPLQNNRQEIGSIATVGTLSAENVSLQRSGASDLGLLLQALEDGSPEDGVLRDRLLLRPSEKEKERYPELSRPLAIELYSGLSGWGEGFVDQGFRCIGFDIFDCFDAFNQPRVAGCELMLRDVRSIHGSELKDATCIVGSSPCQEFSYRAMPWKRAKALPPPYLGMELFNAQFRIQREACEAAGHYIPMVVENVRGAQKWVGPARFHFGTFYLWGDVPAIMPIFDKGFKGFKGFKRNWRDCEASRQWSSHSAQRKQWSAEIAKIPFPLSSHIARCFKPMEAL